MIEGVEVVIRQPGHPDRVVRLDSGTATLGRAEDNDIVLSDVGVSRRHATIAVSNQNVVVEDLGSGNGTYFNGYRVKSQTVDNNDEVVIDPFILQFRVRGQVLQTAAAAEAKTPARLEIVVGSGMAGSSYPIQPRGLTIGRSEDRDIVIPDPAASRHHVTVLVDGETYTLRDEGSANGVFCNGVRVRECVLNDGDMVRIGNTELRFVKYERDTMQSTTQVQEGGWEDLPPPTWQAEPRRRRPWLTMILGGMVAGMALLGVIVVLAIVGVLLLQGGFSLPGRTTTQPPRWTLTLPPGLNAAPVDTLFKEGVDAMRSDDDKKALENFYRVLLADHSNASAKKFAFAAGEHLVVEALDERFQAARKKRDVELKERDKLLKKYAKGRRGAPAAKKELIEKFSDDPKVIEALNLEDPDSLKALKKHLVDGAEHVTNQRYQKAITEYEAVLAGSRDEEMRKTAMGGLRSAQRELARQVQSTWSEAVRAEAKGNLAKAKVGFHNVAQIDPDNHSARLHRTRLGDE